MEWSEISWILRGRLKQKIIVSLDKPKTATILAKELKTHRSTISDILKQMKNNELAECLDSNQPYNRFYKLTEKGVKIREEVKKILGNLS